MRSQSPFEPSRLQVHHRMARTPTAQFLRIQIWDFPSHVHQAKLLQEVERADGVVMVYDAQSAASLAQLPGMIAQLPDHVHKVVVGNLRGKAHSAADLTIRSRQQALVNGARAGESAQMGVTGLQLSDQIDAHFVEGCVARADFAEHVLLIAARAMGGAGPRHEPAISQRTVSQRAYRNQSGAMDYIDAAALGHDVLLRGTARGQLGPRDTGRAAQYKPTEALPYPYHRRSNNCCGCACFCVCQR